MIWRGMFAPDVSPDVAQECRFESVIAKPHFAGLLSGRPDLNRTSPTRIMGENLGLRKKHLQIDQFRRGPTSSQINGFCGGSRGLGSEIESWQTARSPRPLRVFTSPGCRETAGSRTEQAGLATSAVVEVRRSPT